MASTRVHCSGVTLAVCSKVPTPAMLHRTSSPAYCATAAATVAAALASGEDRARVGAGAACDAHYHHPDSRLPRVTSLYECPIPPLAIDSRSVAQCTRGRLRSGHSRRGAGRTLPCMPLARLGDLGAERRLCGGDRSACCGCCDTAAPSRELRLPFPQRRRFRRRRPAGDAAARHQARGFAARVDDAEGSADPRGDCLGGG